MRSSFLVIALLTTFAASDSAVAQPATVSTTNMPLGAPIGHLQPRAQQFAPSSVAEQIEQDRMSNFDARQQKEDEQLDERLNICRGC
jgi:hypothetical protein